MVKAGTRIIEGVNVAVTSIDQLKTPNPTLSDKDSVDIGAKIRYLIDVTEKAKKNESYTHLASATRTTNGDTTSSPANLDYGSVVVWFLDVTAVSGTSPTLDVYIDIQDPASGKWINQDKFAQVTTTGTWGLALPVRSNRYSVRWVLGGTNPSFTFSVGLVIVK
jgi:hypothetical protein